MEDKEEVCRVLFTVDVHYTGSIEHKQSSSAGPADQQPVCPVCLERLEQGMGGILTTICNHSFHCSCISNWTDSSCPLCRYCQQQPEKSICNVCQTSENLWMCVICGSVGCGRCGSYELDQSVDCGFSEALLNSRVEAVILLMSTMICARSFTVVQCLYSEE
ncbi:BRAP2 RING ZnF UBP domain-containing protein 2-like isoform X4 [Cannabis sativa]|uniref:BRAP2 RING ZnF UBP domain-containing protein 2-like isoform X4 n=1 Tax=Cannabis sativa TaxID=3483 RepID=UPI0029CA1413|nr:BRAP2 RING ZnF UBP domain-containing protein 2-like isoform X4 [Cannabis sativa]